MLPLVVPAPIERSVVGIEPRPVVDNQPVSGPLTSNEPTAPTDALRVRIGSKSGLFGPLNGVLMLAADLEKVHAAQFVPFCIESDMRRGEAW